MKLNICSSSFCCFITGNAKSSAMGAYLHARYAADYRAFPHVVATGGDAETLYSDSELVTRVVHDLVLRGILVAVRAAAEAE